MRSYSNGFIVGFFFFLFKFKIKKRRFEKQKLKQKQKHEIRDLKKSEIQKNKKKTGKS